jgi:hypothetical protein
LENKPDLPEDLAIYLQAYERLRGATPGGRIPLSEMLSYCELFCVQDTEDFVDSVQLIERTIEALTEEQQGDDAVHGKPTSGSRPDRRSPRQPNSQRSHPENGPVGGHVDSEAAAAK